MTEVMETKDQSINKVETAEHLEWEDVNENSEGIETEGKSKGKKGGATKAASKPASKPKSSNNLDLKGDEECLQIVNSLLDKANDKSFGKKIEFRDLLIRSLQKITDEDILTLQDLSMSKMDKIHLAHEKFNEDNNTNLSFDEFLFRQLNLQ